MVSRQTYISLIKTTIKEIFIEYTRNKKDDIWFEHNNLPLKWHLPTGVLHDLYNTTNQLPWKIIVHFSNFPSEKIFKITQMEDIQWNFINTLKEVKILSHKKVILFEIWKL
jgi:autophagy-related protein 5